MHSLRWRLALGFALAVILAVGLTGLLAAAGTAQRFEILISEAGSARAQQLAPLLAAEYAYWGDWETVAAQRFSRDARTTDPPGDWFIVSPGTPVSLLYSLEATLEPDGVHFPDFPDFDDAPALQNAAQNNWDRLFIEAANFGGVEWENSKPGQSLSEVVAAEGQDAAVVTQYIIDTETFNINNALRVGAIAPEVAAGYLRGLPRQVWTFVNNARVQFASDSVILVYPPQLTLEGSNWLLETMLFGTERLLVADTTGRVVIDSDGDIAGKMLDAAELGAGAIIYARDDGKTILGTVLVGAEIGLYDAQQRAFLDGVVTTVSLSAVLGGVTALVVGLVIARQVTKPVLDLTRAAERIADGDLDQHVAVRSRDELGQMSQAFNRMAGEIATQQMLRRRLVDDIAHELNTPLSLMQLEIQAMLDGLQSPDEAAGQLQRELAELHGLVADLAYLADADATPALDRTPVDINDLVQEVTARFSSQAETCGLALAVTLCDAPAVLHVDPVRIGRALTNLLSNALRHTPAGGRVTVVTTCEDDAVTITVQDTGEGVPPEDLPYIWERLYRSDRSRSRDTGGRGLGLAIVRQSVEMHGGQVWVESTPGVGSRFGMRLPRSPVV
ncbi:MAG: HAMP domain-containing histidine kinase [Anaerolineae bacterium]|nr:HAMP domain-containing histidine kinase [Anaerolineae bacterium]